MVYPIKNQTYTSCCPLFTGQIGLKGEARLLCHSSEKLFVFGDSYVDTGNTNKEYPGSWKDPYGMTYPGKPSGRFSDGRVLTDYIGKFLALSSIGFDDYKLHDF